MNWSAGDGHTPVPKIALTLAATDGVPMTMSLLEEGCHLAKGLKIDAMTAGTQYTIGGALPRREGATDALRVTINGHIIAVRLRHVCTDAETQLNYDQRSVPCSEDPMQFAEDNGYSVQLTIS